MKGLAARHDACRRFEIEIANMAGVIEVRPIAGRLSGVSFHGPWASHTGYWSAFVDLWEDDTTLDKDRLQALMEQAADRYRNQASCAFVVGDEHREHGWEKISINHRREIQIRLPKWQKGIVAECIQAYGMVLSCKRNNFWTLPTDNGIDLAAAREWLRPILIAKTRFSDEGELARAIDRQAVAMGYARRQPLQLGEAQGSLF